MGSFFFIKVLESPLSYAGPACNSSFFLTKFRFSFSVGLTRGITFLAGAVCFPSPHYADFGENRLLDQLKAMSVVCEARSWDYCFMPVAFRFSQFYLSKAVFINIVHSPRFILSAESSFYTQSVVRGPWSAARSLFCFY